ncbi:S-layer homology domain-containing protein [Cohnella cellulosilytica]
MRKRTHMFRWMSLLLLVSTLIGTMPLNPTASAAHAAQASDEWIDRSGEQTMLFGTVREATEGEYVVSASPIEVSYRGATYSDGDERNLIRVAVRKDTEVVTADNSGMLVPGTAVVVAGYATGNRLEAQVIGDLQAAEPVEEPAGDAMMVDEFMGNAAADSAFSEQTDSTGSPSVSILSDPSGGNSYPTPGSPDVIKRFTTISGAYDKANSGRKDFPALRVGALSISIFFEYSAGLDVGWNWPFEVQTKLTKPVPQMEFIEPFLPGETAAERFERVDRMKSIVKVNVVPQKPKNNWSFYSEVGLRMSVGFEGSILGYDFDARVDLNKLVGGLTGTGLVSSMGVSGKKAPPLEGQSAAIGVKDEIGLNASAFSCGLTGCTFDMFSEDSIGVRVPFFEAGILSMGFVFQPIVVAYGYFPKLTHITGDNGLLVEKIQEYDRVSSNPAMPIAYDFELYPWDALALSVPDVLPGEAAPAITEGGTLNFDVVYEPSIRVGYVVQASISAKKFGIGTEFRLPVWMIELPFNIQLKAEKLGGIQCMDEDGNKAFDKYGCSSELGEGEGIYFPPSVISSKMRLADAEGNGTSKLPLAVSDAPYAGGTVKVLGGVGGSSKLKTSGLLPQGIGFKKTGTDSTGANLYRLEGTPAAKEGDFVVKLVGTDAASAKKDFTLTLPIAKVYPEQVDTTLVEGQVWTQQFKLAGPDGVAMADVNWSLSGDLPAAAYTLNKNTGVLTIHNAPKGDYIFKMTPAVNGVSYEVVTEHHLRVDSRAIAAAHRWTVNQPLRSNAALYDMTYGDIAWHEGLRELIAATPGGLFSLQWQTAQTMPGGPLPYPYYTSMAYYDPSSAGEEGWMYLFGGSEHTTPWWNESRGAVYKLDKANGLVLLDDGGDDHLTTPGAEYGTAVADALTAALPDGRLLVHGGKIKTENAGARGISDETWVFDPSSKQFTLLQPTVHPGRRTGADSMLYVPDLGQVVLYGSDYSQGAGYWGFDPDDRIWLFDPGTMSWQTADENKNIGVADGEMTFLAYSKQEHKLFILITGSGQEGSVTRMYSIDVSGGTLGPVMQEPLPDDAAAWQGVGGLFAYDELYARLLYIQDKQISSYDLPEADKDRQSLVANGEDTIRLGFNLNRYTENIADWDVVWRPIGKLRLLDADHRMTPDADGNVDLALQYADFGQADIHTAHLLVYAAYKGTDPNLAGSEIPIAKATIEVRPVPADPANSFITLTPNELIDHYEEGIPYRSDLIIELRSAGVDGGQPLPNRTLRMRNALELQNLPVTIGPDAEYDENRLIWDDTDLLTDANGRMHHQLWNTGNRPGEYALRFGLEDGSGFEMTSAIEIVPFVPIAKQSDYWYDGLAGQTVFGPSNNAIEFANTDRWISFECSEEGVRACYELVEGEPPAGVTFDAGFGVFRGTPSVSGISQAAIRLPNSEERVTVNFDIRESLSLADEYRLWEFEYEVGDFFERSFGEKVKGGTRPFAFEVDTTRVDGALPPGLALDPDTGVISGSFAESGTFTTVVRMTDSSPLGSRTEWKQYRFVITEPGITGTGTYAYGDIQTNSTILYISQFTGNPAGPAEGVFEPWGGGTAFYELKRKDTSNAAPFTLRFSPLAYEHLDLYYWHPGHRQWEKFGNQTCYSCGESNYAFLSATVDNPDEYGGTGDIWTQGEGLLGYSPYKYLRIAVGAIPPKQPVITGIEPELDEYGKMKFVNGYSKLRIYGDHFAEDAIAYVGGKQTLGGYTQWSEADGKWVMETYVPPGEGKKSVYVMTRGGIGESSEAIFEYPEEMRVPKDGLRLKVTVLPEGGDPDAPLLIGQGAYVKVELVDEEGKKVRLVDTDGFDPQVRVRFFRSDDHSYVRLACAGGDAACQVEGAQRDEMIGYLDGNGEYTGYMYLYNYDDTLPECIGDYWGEDCRLPSDEPTLADALSPDDNVVINIGVTNPDGHYGRYESEAAPPESALYGDTETLAIVTPSVTAAVYSDYEFQFEGIGGAEHFYSWNWGPESEIPHGMVLSKGGRLIFDEDRGFAEAVPGHYAIQVRLSDGVASATRKYHLTVTGAVYTQAGLDGIHLHLTEPAVVLQPEESFDPQQTLYHANVGYSVDEIRLEPLAAANTANVYVQVKGKALQADLDGYYPIRLPIGKTPVTFIAQADDGTMRSYVLEISRASSADLLGLTIDSEQMPGSIAIPITADRQSYSIELPYRVEQFTLHPKTADATASLQLDGKYLTNGATSAPIALGAEAGTVTLQVTARGGVESKLYVITLQRAEAPEGSDPGTDPGTNPGTDPDPNPNPGTNPVADPAAEPSKQQPDDVSGKFGDGFTVTIPLALMGNAERIDVKEAGLPPKLPSALRLSPAFQASWMPNRTSGGALEATVEIRLDRTKWPEGWVPKLFVYDSADGQWLDLGGVRQEGRIVAQSDRLGIFAVFAVPATPEAVFSDASGHWAEQWIALGQAFGVTTGFPDGTFRPNLPVSRLEFTAMLLRMLDADMDEQDREAAASSFNDADRIPAWGVPYANAARRLGIVSGYEDGTFRPEAPISRMEMMVVLSKALNLSSAELSGLAAFSDRGEVPYWAEAAIASVLKAGYVQGRGNGILAPRDRTTRAEVVVMLMQVYLSRE